MPDNPATPRLVQDLGPAGPNSPRSLGSLHLQLPLLPCISTCMHRTCLLGIPFSPLASSYRKLGVVSDLETE